jgi:arsenical pump membrane protein
MLCGLIASEWNVFLFFLGLGISAATADRAGVFRAAAAMATRWAAGNQRRLVVGFYVLAVVVTAVLSNDATALLLTPVVFAIAVRAGVDPRPYAFACALVANAASFVLPVSNPSNVLLLSRAPLALPEFLQHLLPASVLALIVTLKGLLLVFRNELSAPFDDALAGDLIDRRATIVASGVGGSGVLYMLGAAAGWPLGVVALVGAIVLVGLYSATGS